MSMFLVEYLEGLLLTLRYFTFLINLQAKVQNHCKFKFADNSSLREMSQCQREQAECSE